MLKSIFLAASLLIAAGVTAHDCGPTLSSVNVNNIELYQRQGMLNVSFDIDFSSINLGRNQQVIYTPVIVSDNGTEYEAFPKIVLNGRNVNIREQREPSTRVDGASEVFKRNNNTVQIARYNAMVPYSSWMDLSQLQLNEDLCGCGDLKSQARISLLAFDNTPAPDALLIFIEPAVEARKAREERGSAFIDFVVNTVDIRPDYRNNRAELNKIISSIDLVKNDRNVVIDEINIHGFASPEGTWDRNVWLAENRAKALTEYVKGLYSIPSSVFTTASTPEDWAGLRKFLVDSDIDNKAELLSIVDDPSLEPDTKDWRLKLRYPQEYAYMLENWFPALRRSDYVIRYTVRPFSVEEAKAMMIINPQQVSLNEMFLVAQTFEPGSPDYNMAMTIAVETYPDDTVANYNAAVAAINAGNYDAAEKYLLKAESNDVVLNARGVMALNKGDLDEAENYFGKAAAAGNEQAATNLGIVARQRALKAQNR